MMRKLVGIVAPGREVLGEELAAGVNGGNQSLVKRAAAQMTGELAHDLLPGFLRDLLVDGIVGNHSGETLGEGHVDEHAGEALGSVQILHQELLDGSLMCPCALHRFRYEGETKRLPLDKREAERKDRELGEICLLYTSPSPRDS